MLPLAVIILSPKAQARTFKNAYISFEMLDTWKCNLEQTEWVCRAEDPQEAKEAVIILTAKEKGTTDSFPLYENHMNNPITTTTKTGTSLTSTVVYKAQQQRYNDQVWLDGIHRDSEVQNYFTRYVATIKDQIAILVTFTVHNKFYAKHSGHFANTIKSLRVIASKDLLSRPDLGPVRGAGETLGAGIGQAMPADLLAADDVGADGKKGILKNEALMGIGLLLLAVLAYLGLKYYQKNKR
ncbi:MAG: hypothetical protein H7061_10515 [Bdellovibrionaceae bacterium]|nr:hypothetical protein [Bdellovibrio sp.]